MGSATSTDVALPAPPKRSNALPHLPGLDGLRGLAVVIMMLFHGGFTWIHGGFLSISTFFTLSGFLITNILVREYDATRALDLVRFWSRRFRRLMPAAIVTIALIGLVFWRIGTPSQFSTMRGDMISSLTYVANWRFILAGRTYASLSSAPSPFQHYWSLAVEEQFYLVFPLVVLFTMKLGGRRLLTIVCSIAAAASIVTMVALHSNYDRIHYGTDTRVAELLFGVLLAIWWSGREQRRVDRDEPRPTRQSLPIDLLGLGALAAMFLAWTLVPENTPKVAYGGLPLYALGTTIIIYAATVPGIVTRILSMAWLRWAGLISYGLYLFHWPIFLWLSPERTGLSIYPLFALRMTITIALALLSYRFIEMPVRRGTFLRSARTAIPAAALSGLAVVVLAFAIVRHPPAALVPYANMRVGDDYTFIERADPPVRPTATTAHTVYIVGDSGAMDTQPALGAAFVSSGTTEVIYGAGPGFAIGGSIPWRTMWADIIAAEHPDLVVTMFGPWDLGYIKANGIAAYEKLMDEALSVLSSQGARVVWIPVMPGGKNDVRELNAAIHRMGERHPGLVYVPEIDPALAARDGSFPRSLTLDDGTVVLLRKTDDWHLCQAGAERLVTTIMDQLVAIDWSSPPTPGWEDGSWRAAGAYDDPVGVCAVPA